MTDAERRFALHRRRIVPAALALLGGLLCFVAPRIDRTLGQPLRAHGGDVALAAFLFLAAGVVGAWSRRLRAVIALALLFAVELSQLVRPRPEGGLLVELTLGSTFDPFDLVAYVAGAALAWAAEARADRAPSRSARG